MKISQNPGESFTLLMNLCHEYDFINACSRVLMSRLTKVRPLTNAEVFLLTLGTTSFHPD